MQQFVNNHVVAIGAQLVRIDLETGEASQAVVDFTGQLFLGQIQLGPEGMDKVREACLMHVCKFCYDTYAVKLELGHRTVPLVYWVLSECDEKSVNYE